MIPLFKPSVTQDEIDAVARVMRSGWWGLGEEVEQFEEEFAKFVGVKYAVALNSATAALDLAFKAHNLQGKTVVMPALTFVSTGLAALYNNCKIVFGDIEDKTLLLAKIASGVDATVPVWYGGRVALEKQYSYKTPDGVIIEDCAHATGNKRAGQIGTGCWSFQAVKNLATGDGGMLTTNDEEIYKRTRALRWCGIDKSTYERARKQYGWDYSISEVGYKYHMNDIAAAIGRVQLKRLPALNQLRRNIVTEYLYQLSGIEWIRLPEFDIDSSWHMFYIRVDKSIRNQLIKHLLRNDVSAGVHYKPLNHYDIFPDAVLPNTERIWQELITLPLFPDMTEQQFEKVIVTIKSFEDELPG